MKHPTKARYVREIESIRSRYDQEDFERGKDWRLVDPYFELTLSADSKYLEENDNLISEKIPFRYKEIGYKPNGDQIYLTQFPKEGYAMPLFHYIHSKLTKEEFDELVWQLKVFYEQLKLNGDIEDD